MNFDTHGTRKAGEDMLRFLEDIPNEMLVVLVSEDAIEWYNDRNEYPHLTPALKDYLLVTFGIDLNPFTYENFRDAAIFAGFAGETPIAEEITNAGRDGNGFAFRAFSTGCPKPSTAPTQEPTPVPTPVPIPAPTQNPSPEPTPEPTSGPVFSPTPKPIAVPTAVPVPDPTAPTPDPTHVPTSAPTSASTDSPTPAPTKVPIPAPTKVPIPAPTKVPIPAPTKVPIPASTKVPVPGPTKVPIPAPTMVPIPAPTKVPIPAPTKIPIPDPTKVPIPAPTKVPIPAPTMVPVPAPTKVPIPAPTITSVPTVQPTLLPTISLQPTSNSLSLSVASDGSPMFDAALNPSMEAEYKAAAALCLPFIDFSLDTHNCNGETCNAPMESVCLFDMNPSYSFDGKGPSRSHPPIACLLTDSVLCI